jgi:hypothetical protein
VPSEVVGLLLYLETKMNFGGIGMLVDLEPIGPQNFMTPKKRYSSYFLFPNFSDSPLQSTPQ